MSEYFTYLNYFFIVYTATFSYVLKFTTKLLNIGLSHLFTIICILFGLYTYIFKYMYIHMSE